MVSKNKTKQKKPNNPSSTDFVSFLHFPLRICNFETKCRNSCQKVNEQRAVDKDGCTRRRIQFVLCMKNRCFY